MTALAAILLFIPSTAAAHGRLKSSIPAAGAHLGQVPRELRLDFSEAPDLTFSTIQLIGPDGSAVTLGALAYPADSHRSLVVPLAAAMKPGRYTIAWQMAGDDGHPVRGRIEFVIAPGAMGVGIAPTGVTAVASGNEAAGDTSMAGMHHDPVSMPEGNGFGADSAAYVIIRWIQFIALLLAIGAVAFHRFVLANIRSDSALAGDAVAGQQPLVSTVDARAASLGMLAALALAVTLVARLAAQSFAMHGRAGAFDPALMGPMIARTMWGWGWLLELLGIGLALTGFVRERARRATRAGGVLAGATQRWWRVAGAGTVLLAFSPGLSSHAAAAPRLRALAMFADGVHILAASSWLGTLSVLLLAALSVAIAEGGSRGALFVRDAIGAFSPVALVSAGVAAATGVFAAWLHVGTIPNLWGTRYGITLLVKLGVLSVVALTGFYNWRFVQPRLGATDATVQLRRTAFIEAGVAVLVLLVTAVLVASPTSMDAAM